MIIGVTGVFGSGKSCVAKMLAKRLGCGILDADNTAKSVFAARKKEIAAIFGTADRKRLARLVFSDSKKLERLNRIIHPEVVDIFLSRSELRKNVVWDVPLLVEAKMHSHADVVIVVKCVESTRIKRLVKKGFTLGEIKQRTRTQLPFGRKIRHADYVVDNSGSISDTGKQIENIVKKMKNKQWKAANRLGQPLSRI